MTRTSTNPESDPRRAGRIRTPVEAPGKKVRTFRLSGVTGAMTDTPSSIGKFRIDGLLGKGGMGVVYRGWDPTLERPVAIKVIHAHLCQGELGEQLLARFRNEAIAAARLSHPNVVPVYEFGEHDGSPFIAMAFIEGGPFILFWSPSQK